jgi:Fe-S cluster biogenesis protein NfuA
MTIDRRSVEIALDELRPSFLMEGGDLRLVNITDDGVVEVALSGACNGCGMSLMHVKMGVERWLKEMVPEVREVVAVEY